MKPKVAESGVLRACLDLLAAERVWHMRINSGAMSGSHKGKRWFVRYAKPGTADILATPIGGCELEILWIECKSSNGKQSPEQELFQQEVELHGHQYLLVRDVSELQDWLKRNK